MTDSSLRELERRFRASGSVEDEAAWLRARVQAGELHQSRLEVAAYCGHKAASSVVTVAGPKTVGGLVSGLAPWASEELWRRVALALLHGAESACVGPSAPHAALIVQLLEDDVACRCEEHWGELASLPNPPYPLDPAGRAVARAARYAASAAKSPGDALEALQQVARAAAGALTESNRVRVLCDMLRTSLIPWALGYGDPVRERVEARQREATGE